MARTQYAPASMYRSQTGLGVWEHRGKVAVIGIGMSPTTRRWDETVDTSVAAWTLLAARNALEDAGVSGDQVDGVVTCPVGLGDRWPRTSRQIQDQQQYLRHHLSPFQLIYMRFYEKYYGEHYSVSLSTGH